MRRLWETRPIVPAAFLLGGLLLCAFAFLPDAACVALVSGVLKRAAKPETLADWHALQRAAGLLAIAAFAIGGAAMASWWRIESLLERLDGFLHRSSTDRAFDATAVLLVVGTIHGIALWYGQLRGDDYIFLREARAGLGTMLMQPWGGHFSPLWRLETVAMYRLWGLDSVPFRWWNLASICVLGYVQARLLTAWGIGRSARLVGIVTLGGWTQWAQITMGYWTLSICVKVLIAITIAMRAAIADDWPDTRRKAVILVSGLGAVLVDSPGALVVPALVVASIASRLAGGASLGAAVRASAWAIAIACCAALIVLSGHWLATMDNPNMLVSPSVPYVIRFVLYLLTFGTAGALVLPVITSQLPGLAVQWSEIVVPALGIAVLWYAWRRASRSERAALGCLLGMLCSAVALLAAARAYPDYSFMVLWTHYMAYLYVPLTGLLAVFWQVWWRARVSRRRSEAQCLALACVAFLGAQEGSGAIAARMMIPGGREWERRYAEDRGKVMATVRDSILLPLTRAVPDGAVIPQLLGRHLNARFPRFHPLVGTSFYVEAAGIPSTRFRWVVGPYTTEGEPDDPVETQVVSTMRNVVDPAFRTALRRPSYWRDTYFSSFPITATPTPPVACEAARRALSPMTGDADHRHWLLFSVAEATASSTLLQVTFRTDFRKRATYVVEIEPRAKGCVRLELLNLAELVMSDRITVSEVTGGETRGISIAGLFPSVGRGATVRGVVRDTKHCHECP